MKTQTDGHDVSFHLGYNSDQQSYPQKKVCIYKNVIHTCTHNHSMKMTKTLNDWCMCLAHDQNTKRRNVFHNGYTGWLTYLLYGITLSIIEIVMKNGGWYVIIRAWTRMNASH